MASTKATFPLRARSIMSPPARGQSMTRLPLTSSTPSTVTLWSAGLSSCSLKKSILVPQHPELADGTVQVHQLLLREGLAPLQDLPRPRVRGAHLRLLLIGEGENVQDQELIYLSTVEHVARTFGGDLRIVGEDYRGRKQHVLDPFLPDQHGPGLLVLTPFRKSLQLPRRISHRNEGAPFYLERGVRRAEGPAQRVFPIFPLPGGGVGDLDCQPENPLPQSLSLDLDLSAQREPAAHESSQDVARWTRDLFLATPTRNVYPCPCGCVLQFGKSALADSDLTLGSFVPRQVLISTYL